MIQLKTIMPLLVIILLIIGCSTTNPNEGSESKDNSGSSAPVNNKAICGNGVAEQGETSENCCEDVPCESGYDCESTIEGGETIYFCKKMGKEETYEYGKFQDYDKKVMREVSKRDRSLIQWDLVFTNIDRIKTTLSELESQGFDVSLENEYIMHVERRANIAKIVDEKSEELEDVSEAQQISIAKEIIALYENEIDKLNSITADVKKGLDMEFEYDIDAKIDHANSKISEFETLKGKLEMGTSAEIDVTNVETYCYSYSDQGGVRKVSVGILNTGGFEIESPRVDVFLSKINQISEDTGNYLGYKALAPEEERFEEIYVGFSQEGISCGQIYDLTINLRSGDDPEVIASKEIKLEIKDES